MEVEGIDCKKDECWLKNLISSTTCNKFVLQEILGGFSDCEDGEVGYSTFYKVYAKSLFYYYLKFTYNTKTESR